MSAQKLCFLCDKRGKKTALHRIPKDPKVRPTWIKFCKLDETIDDVSGVKICSAHFTLDDYIEPMARELGRTLRLKPGTVPSILKPRRLLSSRRTESTFTIKAEPHFLQNVPIRGLTQAPVSSILSIPARQQGEEIIVKCENEDLDQSNFLSATCIPIKQENDEGCGEIIFAEPIKYPIKKVATEKVTERALLVENSKIAKLVKKIRTLQQSNRRLRKRLCRLQNTVDSLRKSNSATDKDIFVLVD